MWWRFKKKTERFYQPPVQIGWREVDVARPANENCFWKWMFGPIRPFETANVIRQHRQQVLDDPAFLPEGKTRVIDHCDVFLALFQAIHVEQDERKARALAPKLNRHVPELMQRCPIRELRPDRM